MRVLLTSRGLINVKENEVTIDSYLNENNNYIKLLKNELKEDINVLFVSNDFTDYESNDHSAKMMEEAYKKENIKFLSLNVLDDRTINKVKLLVEKADLIYLQGGKVLCQIESLINCKFDKYIKESSALIIGQSAGSMNLATKVYNYPEDDNEAGDPKFIDGIGITNMSIIPHFNLDTGNDFCFSSFNLLEEYFIPDSYKMDLYALIDGSYIFINNNIIEYYGDIYLIKNGQISKLN